ncbi:MAG: YeeE/YedE family protein [Gammaproteobacteria bacterium]
MHPYVSGLIGGLMIGGAAALLFWLNGRIAGVSGITTRAVLERAPAGRWRWWWLVGLLAGGAVAIALHAGAPFTPRAGFPVPLLIAAGLLVGFGTRYGSGCTSGHGVCGVSRMSPRSLIATGVFMTAGAASVFVVRHIAGVL